MFTWLTQLTFAQLSWLSVIIYILHYAEEGPRLVYWFNNDYTGRAARKLSYTQKKLNLENGLLFTFTVIIVILFNLYPDNLILRTLIFGSVFGFVGNTIFHALPTLRTGVYSPGVITASMFNPPAAVIYIWKMSVDGMLTLPIIIGALAAGILILPVFINLTHNVLLRNE